MRQAKFTLNESGQAETRRVRSGCSTLDESGLVHTESFRPLHTGDVRHCLFYMRVGVRWGGEPISHWMSQARLEPDASGTAVLHKDTSSLFAPDTSALRSSTVYTARKTRCALTCDMCTYSHDATSVDQASRPPDLLPPPSPDTLPSPLIGNQRCLCIVSNEAGFAPPALPLSSDLSLSIRASVQALCSPYNQNQFGHSTVMRLCDSFGNVTMTSML